MRAIRQRLGNLDCVVFPPSSGRPPDLCVVLCHGFGAPGTDLVPLAFELVELDESLAERVLFVFPEAPHALDDEGIPGGRAWWPLNVNALMASIARGELRILRDTTPPGISEARERLLAALADLRRQTGLPLARFVLGGFSQGAMLATDATLHLPEPTAALALFSGTLLCESTWHRLASARAGGEVLQSHGRYDSILPFETGIWLRDLFERAGWSVDFVEFAGDHTIPAEAVRRFARLLAQKSLASPRRVT
ncbi:MAG: phospholipase [Planctomycetes bacterium]|nr:phospholipase [Planctomycetota bacterium]